MRNSSTILQYSTNCSTNLMLRRWLALLCTQKHDEIKDFCASSVAKCSAQVQADCALVSPSGYFVYCL